MPFRTAISGLRAAQAHLGTIGNNVANANTTGFKQGRTEFADIYASTQNGVASNQAGTGVDVTRVTQQFAQGNISSTDSVLDLAVDGQGFFQLEDSGSAVYSRAGAFGLDKDGFIVNGQNQKLVTYQVDGLGNVSNTTAPIQITAASSTPNATAAADVRLNLNSNADIKAPAFDPADIDSYNSTTSLTTYDSLGNSQVSSLYYKKTGGNTWESYLYVDNRPVPALTGTPLAPTPQTLAFDASGVLTTPASGSVIYGTETPPDALSQTMAFDYSGTTQFGAEFSTASLTQDGNPSGQLSGIAIDNEGVVFANFTHGEPQAQGQIVLANFQNPNGLQQLGNNAWGETSTSGQALPNKPGAAGIGFIRSGALEGSNVDLTEQLVELIEAQRNFQANAQVITTADTITQTVINIR